MYLNIFAVKKLIRDHKKQSTKEFLFALDCRVFEIVTAACEQFNGHHSRLTLECLPKKKGG